MPAEEGCLTSIAVTVDKQIYLYGGYSIAIDCSESSSPEELSFGATPDNLKMGYLGWHQT